LYQKWRINPISKQLQLTTIFEFDLSSSHSHNQESESGEFQHFVSGVDESWSKSMSNTFGPIV